MEMPFYNLKRKKPLHFVTEFHELQNISFALLPFQTHLYVCVQLQFYPFQFQELGSSFFSAFQWFLTQLCFTKKGKFYAIALRFYFVFPLQTPHSSYKIKSDNLTLKRSLSRILQVEEAFLVCIQPQWFTNVKDTASDFAAVHSDFVKSSCKCLAELCQPCRSELCSLLSWKKPEHSC